MRTTLDLRDDLLQAAREEAARSKRSIGEVISQWAASGLNPVSSHALEVGENRQRQAALQPERRNGIRLLPRRDEIITNEHIDKLREELGV
jgi:hypothetical protein